jgi:hypothetical protein
MVWDRHIWQKRVAARHVLCHLLVIFHVFLVILVSSWKDWLIRWTFLKLEVDGYLEKQAPWGAFVGMVSIPWKDCEVGWLLGLPHYAGYQPLTTWNVIVEWWMLLSLWQGQRFTWNKAFSCWTLLELHSNSTNVILTPKFYGYVGNDVGIQWSLWISLSPNKPMIP